MYHFLFPEGRPGRCDELFADQFAAVTAAEHTASLVSSRGTVADIPAGRRVVYRGWMLTAGEYAQLVGTVLDAGGQPLSSPAEYLAAHHLPNWYPLLLGLTPETRVYPADANLGRELSALAWGGYFVKDYVKSLKTGRGSVVREPADAAAVVAELRESRGRLEGGVCVRRLEVYRPNTERRYFVLGGTPHAADEEPVPAVVATVAGRINSPFFSVDVAERDDGVMRVVEVGDGQVSDLVGWTPEAFAALWPTAS